MRLRNFTRRFLISAFFSAPFNSKWKETKRFTVQTLKNTGFGTPKSEEKIINETEELMKYIEDQKGAAFETKGPLENTTSNTLASILLNERYPWWSDEQRKLIKTSEMFMESLKEMFILGFINRYIPLFLMKIFCRKQMEQCKSKNESLVNFIREKIEEHKATIDLKNTRDFIDAYLVSRKDKEWGLDKLACSISAFFPDGSGTTADTINWAILHLGYHPEDQKEAQKQLDEVTIIFSTAVLAIQLGNLHSLVCHKVNCSAQKLEMNQQTLQVVIEGDTYRTP